MNLLYLGYNNTLMPKTPEELISEKIKRCMKYYYLPKIVQKNATDLLTLVVYRIAYKEFGYDPITMPISL